MAVECVNRSERIRNRAWKRAKRFTAEDGKRASPKRWRSTAAPFADG